MCAGPSDTTLSGRVLARSTDIKRRPWLVYRSLGVSRLCCAMCVIGATLQAVTHLRYLRAFLCFTLQAYDMAAQLGCTWQHNTKADEDLVSILADFHVE